MSDTKNADSPAPKSETTTKTSSLFDPAKFRLGQNYNQLASAIKQILGLHVGRPGGQDWVRTSDNPDHTIDIFILEDKAERESYLVDPELYPILANELVAKTITLALTKQGGFFLWAARLPDESGRLDRWNTTAREAMKLAQKEWVRMTSNMSAANYDVYVATGEFPEPEWPDFSTEKLLELGFKDKLIKSLDHPVVKKLQGAE
jgi:hypothetical protein